MSANLFERFRQGLLGQRRNLADWLLHTPPDKKRLRLGPAGEQAIEAHLQTLDAAIQKTEDETLGLCTVCHDYIESSRLEMDYTACVCLEHMTGDEKSRLEQELELSQKVQKALLPQEIPNVPGLQLAAFSQPAQIVGGDYFDFFEFRDGRFGFAVGDVMGKGMSASLLMANLQASLRILVRDHDTPDAVLARLNTLFVHNIRLTKFVTLFLARYDSTARTLMYGNAGHNPPMVLRQGPEGGSVSWLRPNGAAVGLVEDSTFRTDSVRLRAGDVLVFYTDGVTETRNPKDEEFGEERLAEMAQKHCGLPPSELIKRIREAIREFAGNAPPMDDTTMVVGRVG
jgi:sigma-B regulation protein RsbU (phosphoserine phosphatase)